MIARDRVTVLDRHVIPLVAARSAHGLGRKLRPPWAEVGPPI